jgi:hypothetical protein
MKLKLALLVTAALAGTVASVALAGRTDHGGDHGKGAKCQEIRLTGTLAAGSLAVAVTHANHHGPAAGSTASVAVPAGTRIRVEACQTGTGTAATFTLRGAELHFRAPKPAETTTTSTTTTP